MTALALIQQSWDQAAVQDAMFNIITDPARSGGGWTEEAFFAYGREEIDEAMERRRELRLVDDSAGRALDFGCGIGRLTYALARWYDRVDGVDVSGEMIARARDHNTDDTVVFHHNTAGDLALFETGTFGLVYSMVVLQHMPQDLQHGYVAEFFRVLKPGGVAMIHIPDGPDSGDPGWHLSMHGVPRKTVEEWIADAGGTLVDVEDLGVDNAWRNYRYTAVAS